MIAETFENSFHIPYGNALTQEHTKHLLQIAVGDYVGHQILHDGGIGFLDVFHHGAHVLSAEYLGAVSLYNLGQVGYHDRNRINQSVAGDIRHNLLVLAYPFCGNSESWLYGVDTFNRTGNLTVVQRKKVIHKYFSPRHFFALYFDYILIGIYFGVVSHSDRGYYHTHFHRELFSEENHAVNKVSAAFFVHQMQQTVSEFHFYLLNIQKLEYVVYIAVVIAVTLSVGRLYLFKALLLFRLCHGNRLFFSRTGYHCARENQSRSQYEKYRLREAGYEHEYYADSAGNEHYGGISCKLNLYVLVKASGRSGSGYDHTCGNRDKQGGNLRTETVAYRSQ